MKTTETHEKHECVPMPDFERLNYFYGQDLGVADFQVEQQYFVDKLRLANRCFHGTGIVCGLDVEPAPQEEDCDSYNDEKRTQIEQEIKDLTAKIDSIDDADRERDDAQSDQEKKELEARREELRRVLDKLPDCPDPKVPPSKLIWLNCGWAIDCHGREIIVRHSQPVDLGTLLGAADHRAIADAARRHAPAPVLELSVCYCEQPTYPSRPRLTDKCDTAPGCKYGRVREGYRLRLSLSHQPADTRCSNCCEPCECECIVLAHIHWPYGRSVTWDDIDLAPRRAISVYQPSVIDGVSWQHGAVYSSDNAKSVLGTTGGSNPRTDGIEVRFSKPIYAETLQPGVVDLLRIQGGGGLSGVISHVEGSFVNKPAQGLIDRFQYRDESGETLNNGDRLLIVIRSNFILDACCKPVDGENVGGLTPQLPAYVDHPTPNSTPPLSPCASRRQPWTSGNGRPGATFESWFYVD